MRYDAMDGIFFILLTKRCTVQHTCHIISGASWTQNMLCDVNRTFFIFLFMHPSHQNYFVVSPTAKRLARFDFSSRLFGSIHIHTGHTIIQSSLFLLSLIGLQCFRSYLCSCLDQDLQLLRLIEVR